MGRKRARSFGGKARAGDGPQAPQRFAAADLYPPQPDGVCRFCRGRVTAPGRKNWCSEACVQQYLGLRCGEGLRTLVFKRDVGVCKACGLDTTYLDTVLRSWRSRTERAAKVEFARIWDVLSIGKRKTLWDADHIVAVADGGGSSPIRNVQTLCIWCHKRKSVEQADRKAGRPLKERPTGKQIVEPILAAGRLFFAK